MPKRLTAVLLAVGGGILLPVTALPLSTAAHANPVPAAANVGRLAAGPTPTPSPGAETIDRAGTSFLTATPVKPGQPIRVDASTGDYLYWSFDADAGQTTDIAVTVTLPTGGKRTGGSTWAVDVFDGLRRRQPCTAGTQTPTADAQASNVTLGCTLRRVRSWAEPWSGDPLPGTYYVRLSVTDVPETDLGLSVRVDMVLAATDGGTSADDGRLEAPLVPPARPGRIATAADGTDPTASASPEPEDDGNWAIDWLPDLSARWIWTIVGGVLAAVAGVVGFSLTWRRRRV